MSARALVLIALASTGCRYLLDDDEPAPAADAPGVDQLCGLGAGVLSAAGFCAPAPIAEEHRIEATSLDTDRDPRCLATTAGDICVIAAAHVVLENIAVTGRRPLIVLGANTLAVAGLVRVSPDPGSTVPAPGAERDCTQGVPGVLSGGGAGGSFGTRGAEGGVRAGTGLRASPGAAIAHAPPAALRGGCAGSSHVAGGSRGGGAVYLLAFGSIAITGRLDASGAPGLGGNENTNDPMGGGGGGSGGMIVLDASTIEIAAGAEVLARGGGGGEGATSVEPGRSGNGASGGLGGPADGGDGGGGAANGAPPQVGIDGAATGGGGGGGHGVIWVRGTLADSGVVDPPPRRL